MKFQDLEEKLDIMSENMWTSQQKNGNYKKRKKKKEILENKIHYLTRKLYCMGSVADWRPHKTVNEFEHSSVEIIQFEGQRKDSDYKRMNKVHKSREPTSTGLTYM